MISLSSSMDSESELISLISNTQNWIWDYVMDSESELISLITRIIFLVSSMDLNAQPKPESEFMSLITQAISVFCSIDFDSLPTVLLEFISYISQEIPRANSVDSHSNRKLFDFDELLTLEPEPEILSLSCQIVSLVTSRNLMSEKFILLCPQVGVTISNGKFQECEKVPRCLYGKWECLPLNWLKFNFTGEDATHFYCKGCDSQSHEEFIKAPIEFIHHLHRKLSLRLVLFQANSTTRKCYCCDEDLERIFYYCSVCDFGINFACVKKPPVLSIDYPKWHEHTLHLFPRHASLTCNLCALADASSPILTCNVPQFLSH